jgi:hypothetical protein
MHQERTHLLRLELIPTLPPLLVPLQLQLPLRSLPPRLPAISHCVTSSAPARCITSATLKTELLWPRKMRRVAMLLLHRFEAHLADRAWT